MKYVIGALQWKLPRAPLLFNPDLSLSQAFSKQSHHGMKFNFLSMKHTTNNFHNKLQ